MIVLSLVLVIVAAVTLIAGFFQDESLTLIYVAIVSCVLAMAFLGIGVLQRKRSSKPASAGAYGSGSGSSGSAQPASGSSSSAPARSSGGAITPVRPKQPVGSSVGAEADTDEGSTQVIVRKTAAADAAKREAPRKKAVAKKAVAKRPSAATAEPVTELEASERATPVPTRKASAAKKASTKAAAAKKAPRAAGAKKSTTGSAPAKKSTAKKSTAKKSTAKKSTAKKAGTRTAGGKAEARSILASVKGLGPAKQDAVLAEFGSVAALRQASTEQLSEIRGIGDGLAQSIKDAVR